MGYVTVQADVGQAEVIPPRVKTPVAHSVTVS